MKENMKAIGKYYGALFTVIFATGIIGGLATVAVENELGEDCATAIGNIIDGIAEKRKK